MIIFPGVYFVVGNDSNTDLLELCNVPSRFLDTMLCNLLYPKIYSVTRPASGTLLENLFVSWPCTFLVMLFRMIYRIMIRFCYLFPNHRNKILLHVRT